MAIEYINLYKLLLKALSFVMSKLGGPFYELSLKQTVTSNKYDLFLHCYMFLAYLLFKTMLFS